MAEEVRREGAAAEARWRDWIALGPERREWEVAKKCAAMAWRDMWANWAPEDRRAAAKYLLSPFGDWAKKSSLPMEINGLREESHWCEARGIGPVEEKIEWLD